jgi:large subunit ribosomal protein L29
MKATEIRQLSNEELGRKLKSLEEDFFKLRLQKHTGQLTNTSQLGLVRRDIARVKTEMNARRNAGPVAQES